MSFKEQLRVLIKPYYWFNILLSLSYVTCKRTPVICQYLHPGNDCELDSRETEILFFLIIVVMLRTRKAGSVTMINYLTSSFVYTKIANLILWFYADIRYGLVFAAIFILFGLLLPQPSYEGPEYITYFRGVQSLEEEIRRNTSVTWVVCAYAAWHPACVNFAPVFSQLSAKYCGTHLKFAKIDVGRYPEASAKYHIDDGPTSRQLPTVMVIKQGAETARRPQADPHTRKLQKFVFSIENIKEAFNLDSLYEESKKKAEQKETKKSQ